MAVITESYRRMQFFRDECEYGMGYVNLPSIGAEFTYRSGREEKRQRPPVGRGGLVEVVIAQNRVYRQPRHRHQDGAGLTTAIEGGPA